MSKKYVKVFKDMCLFDEDEELSYQINKYITENPSSILLDIKYRVVYDTKGDVYVHSALCIFDLKDAE